MVLPLISMHTEPWRCCKDRESKNQVPWEHAAGREGDRESQERMPWKVLLAKLSSEVRRGSEE